MQAPLDLHASAQRILTRCRALADCTEVPGETTRTFLSEPMRTVHRLATEWMTAAGMQVRLDSIGNLHGLKGSAEAPRLLIASHLDTVPNAGAFDGILGVLLGIDLAEHFPSTNLSVEVIGFSEEEGIRFRKPFLGSLAATGTLHPTHLALVDANQITLASAIRDFGLDPATLADAKLSPKTIAYLEFHIEQGPILESLNRALGIVTSLVGQTRMEFVFTGQANHAGTTPMHLRKDAMAAAAEWIVAVEALALHLEGLVATVGRVETRPGAGNVIPGSVLALLDVRHADDAIRAEAIQQLITSAHLCGSRRGVHIAPALLMEQPAVPLDRHLTALLKAASHEAGHPAHPMTSGAGHDAMIIAPHIPSAMLFLRSPGGLSHHPDEAVLLDDIEAALATGLVFIQHLAQTHPPEYP